MLKMVSRTSCFVIFVFKHILLQIRSLFPLSIPHFSMGDMVILIQIKKSIRDTFTMELFKNLLRKGQMKTTPKLYPRVRK